MNIQTLGERIQLLKNKVGMVRLSADAGISHQQINRYIRGGSQATIGPIVAMAKSAGVSIEWLATGVGEVDKELAADPNTDSIVELQLLNESQSISNQSKQAAPVYFSKNFLSSTFGFDTQKLYVYLVDTDENAGGIKYGDILVIDSSTQSGNGLFVINVNNHMQVLKLLHLPSGVLQINHGDLPSESYTLTQEQQSTINIIGRVAWQGGKS